MGRNGRREKEILKGCKEERAQRRKWYRKELENWSKGKGMEKEKR